MPGPQPVLLSSFKRQTGADHANLQVMLEPLQQAEAIIQAPGQARASLENHNKGKEGQIVTYTCLALTTFTPHTSSHSQHRADGKLETASVCTCAPRDHKSNG
ncbi:hypothetical protein MC885_003515 [Smutsia gigantea]|nr:hypothetical protein MC885_003515 [Smutsia gigantea]